MDTVGVIDIGSNSVRLVIASIDDDGKHFKILDEVKESVRLGRDIDDRGNLSKKRVDILIESLKGFKSLSDSIGVKNLIVVATAAIRSATNRLEVLKKIKDKVGIDVRIISGEEEAYYDYYGTINSTSIENGLLVDIGGCSTEIVQVADRKLVNSVSLPIGSLNITDTFKIEDKLDSIVEGKVVDYLQRIYDSIPWLREADSLPIVGIGGTFRNIAKIERKKKKYPFELTHNYQMKDYEIREICEILKESSYKQRRRIRGLSKDRADIILGATLIVETLFDYCNGSGVVISGSGIREGFIYEYILSSSDILIDDVVDYEIRRTIRRYDVLESHAEHIWKLSQSLFKQLKPVHRIKKNGVANLFKTAALLHDIGVSVDYYSHHDHSFYIILNSNIKGLSHREMLMAAFIASKHRKDKLNISESKYSSMISLEDIEIIEKLGCILKISESLDRRLDGSIKDVSVTICEDSVKLELLTDIDNLELEKNNLSAVEKSFFKIFDKKLKY